MASKRTGLIARWLARRAGRVAPEAGPVGAKADVPSPNAAATTQARPVAQSPVAEPDSPAPAGDTTAPEGAASSEGTTDRPAPAPSGEAPGAEPEGEEPAATVPAGEEPADEEPTDEEPARTAPTDKEPTDEKPTANAPTADGRIDVAPTNAGSTTPAIAPEPEAEAEERPEGETAFGDATAPEEGKHRDQASAARDHKVITLVSLVAHSGARTVGAALAGKARAKGWQIRVTGPGLTRAAFSGMLADTDALVLVAPADPEATAALGEKLRWLEANNRPLLPGRTIFVVNLGTADGSALQLPADLSRPLVLLPFDAALSLPGTSARAPRRAARHAVDQLVDELSTILQEH